MSLDMIDILKTLNSKGRYIVDIGFYRHCLKSIFHVALSWIDK